MKMAAIAEDSKILPYFLPPLAHLALVKVAATFFNECIIQNKIQAEDSTSVDESSEKFYEEIDKKIKKNLPPFSKLYRRQMLDTILGMRCTLSQWQDVNEDVCKLKKKEEIDYQFHFDGTINTIKTVELLLRDVTIGIKKRFQIAGLFGLQKTILRLWSEMEASNETENYMMRSYRDKFWFRRMRVKSPLNWNKVVAAYLKELCAYPSIDRWSSMLSSLPAKKRQKYFLGVIYLDDDDFLLCARLMTEKEQEKLLEGDTCSSFAKRVLLQFLQFPLQSFFLEKSEKLLNYLDECDFLYFINTFSHKCQYFMDFDYIEMFSIFWSNCPKHLQKSVRRDLKLIEDIDWILDESKQQREDRKKEIDLCRQELMKSGNDESLNSGPNADN